MGILIVDEPCGRRAEYDTVSCKHCQAVIRILILGLTREPESKHRCGRCRGPLCKCCAKNMADNGGVCNEPFMAKVEHAVKTGAWDERFRREYRSCSRP